MPDMSDSPQSDSGAKALGHRDYHLLVGPVLEVCANQAATRNDPTLYNDMPSMLTLFSLVDALCKRHLAEGKANADDERYQHAPIGACAMVLEEAELEEEQMQDCLWALKAAHRQLAQDGVVAAPNTAIDRIYVSLTLDDRDTAREILEETALGMIQRIDTWERSRNDELGTSE